MKKKTVRIILAIVLVLAMLPAVLFCIEVCDVFVSESPNGDYQIVSLWIDKGGFGYGGAQYLKEKGLFSKWHRICKVPSSCEWISETEFTVNLPDVTGERHNVNEFLDE